MDINSENAALLILDTLFQYFDEYGEFNIYYRIPEGVEFKSSSGLSYHPVSRVSELLGKYGYATIKNNNMVECLVELTERGREAKAAGGHFVYLKKIAEKEKIENERQHRKDNLDHFDLFIKKWTYKSRYLPYIASFGALLVSILAYLKTDDKKPLEQKVITVQQNDTISKKDTTSKLK